MFIDYVSTVISYIYQYRYVSRITLRCGICSVVNRLNLAFPSAEGCVADVEFSPKMEGGRVCVLDPPHPRYHWSTASASQIRSRLFRPWPTSAVESAQLTAASVGNCSNRRQRGRR